ncbi:MAG TPA: hypothetical protein PK970_06800 [Hyphomicrobiaceae bacterium]|nr:hypothetical protein [Hyphomicrobiaceae bacterium]
MTIGVTALHVLSTLLVALLSAMSWGAGETGRIVLPMLPILAIVYWSGAERRPMLSSGVFITGLFADMVFQAPTGHWTLVALATALFVRAASRSASIRTPMRRSVIALAAIPLALASSWCLSFFYTGAPAPVWPYLSALPWLAAAFIPLAAVLGLADRLVERAGGERTVLGGGA